MSARAARHDYPPLEDLGSEIRQLRKVRSITLQQLALNLGLRCQDILIRP